MKGEFLAGPIPLPWLSRACEIPGGKALAVALTVRWRAGIDGRQDRLAVTAKGAARFGVYDPSTKWRSLRALEEAGLIRLETRPGANPRASILGGTQSKEYLRGPIPLSWLSRACEIPGWNTLAVALALWWVVGCRDRCDGLDVSSAILERFHVTGRPAKSRALRALEEAGLIQVDSAPGKAPRVTVLEVKGNTSTLAGPTQPSALPPQAEHDGGVHASA